MSIPSDPEQVEETRLSTARAEALLDHETTRRVSRAHTLSALAWYTGTRLRQADLSSPYIL
jgi:hypothetical protein